MSDAVSWPLHHLPLQTDRLAVVTGANSGIGLEAARGLAALGARVVLACRSVDKGEAARRDIEGSVATARVEVRELDLASLESVRLFAEGLADEHDRLDLLVNNAGVMALPRRETADGFEMQFGTNHLGHFALTGRLLPLLLAADAGRVVTVSSLYHKRGRIRFSDLQRTEGYDKWGAYAQSKLANLLFALELDRRLRAADAEAASLAAHPGYTSTNLQFRGPEMSGSSVGRLGMQALNSLVAMPTWKGALPTLVAATSPDVEGGDYVGPDGWGEVHGEPGPAEVADRARDRETARRLWEASEALTGVRYDLPVPA